MTTKEPYTITVGDLRSMLQEVDSHIDDLSKDEFIKLSALFDYETVKAGKDPSYYKRLNAASRIYILGKLAGMKEAVSTCKKKNPRQAANENKRIDPEEILDILKKQKLDFSEPAFSDMCNLFKAIEKHCRETPSSAHNVTRWACWYAMQYGRIKGIREERRRYK